MDRDGPLGGRPVTTTDFEAGVLLFCATAPSGTSTLASGKYVAQQRRGIGYATATNRRAIGARPGSGW